MPRPPKQSPKIPKSIWVVFYQDETHSLYEAAAAVYTDPNEIGDLADDEIVAHYHLAKPTKSKE